MKCLFIPIVLLAPLAVGCSNDKKSSGDQTVSAKGNSAVLASVGGDSKIPTTPEARRADPVYSYLDSSRKDLSEGKVGVINQVMRLSGDESAKFWPIYHDYEEELFSLGDQRVEMARAFLKAQSSQTFDNDKA